MDKSDLSRKSLPHFKRYLAEENAISTGIEYTFVEMTLDVV